MINFNPNLPVYEIFTTGGSIFAVNFKSEIEAEENYLLEHPIDGYLGIGEVTPIDLNDDGEDCNLDGGCPADRIIRGAKGRFAGCRPAGGGGGGGGAAASEAEVPKTINSKTNLAQLRAIAQKEGVEVPTKGANKRQTWIDAIEKKAGDKYKGKTGRPSSKSGGEPVKKTQTAAPASTGRPAFKSSDNIDKIDKDLVSWRKDYKDINNILKKNRLERNISINEALLKSPNKDVVERAQKAIDDDKFTLSQITPKIPKDSPYLNVDNPDRLSGNYLIGGLVADSKGSEKIAVYDGKGNVQAAAAYQKIDQEYIDNFGGKDPHIYVDYLATAPWNIAKTDKTVRGAGTEAIISAVELSKKEGFDGRVRLSPTDDAKPFYDKLGFKLDKDSGYDYELSPQDAKILLSKVGR